MRLFVAVDVDPKARERVIALQKEIASRVRGRADLCWTRPEQLHLTLAFIGEVDERTGATVGEAMRAPIAAAPYALVFGGLGVFPPRGAPRVLWLGSSSGARETIDLQRIVAERLSSAGIELERRPFHAHLTLARWRESGDRDRRVAADAAGSGEVARTVVDTVTLYQSRLSQHGSTYTALVRTPLNQP